MDVMNSYTAGSSDRMMKDQGVQTEDIVQQGMYILHDVINSYKLPVCKSDFAVSQICCLMKYSWLVLVCTSPYLACVFHISI